MDPRLPPLNGLRTFVMACRTRSFAKAAEELSVTPAAVSRSIRTLEDYLGCALFRRLHRSIELTSHGQRYFDELDSVFDQIALATQNLMAETAAQPLVVCAYPSFIVNWLVPRWARQLQTDMSVKVKFVTTHSHEIDFDGAGIHLALLTDRANYPGCLSTWLFAAHLVPICRPNFLPPGTGIMDVEDWQNALLHSETRLGDWGRWAAANDITVDTSRGIRFENSAMMYEAVTSGLGIGIGIKEVLTRDFITGRMALAFPDSAPLGSAYYLVRPAASQKHPFFQPFVDWLMNEARAMGIPPVE
ncbi:MAG: LysR family transcriptional regulator [Qingshengfaniella sp.]